MILRRPRRVQPRASLAEPCNPFHTCLFSVCLSGEENHLEACLSMVLIHFRCQFVWAYSGQIFGCTLFWIFRKHMWIRFTLQSVKLQKRRLAPTLWVGFQSKAFIEQKDQPFLNQQDFLATHLGDPQSTGCPGSARSPRLWAHLQFGLASVHSKPTP